MVGLGFGLGRGLATVRRVISLTAWPTARLLGVNVNGCEKYWFETA